MGMGESATHFGKQNCSPRVLVWSRPDVHILPYISDMLMEW